MTDITVRRTTFQAENRSWLLGPAGTEPGDNPAVTLDVSKFTAGTHYPNGFIPSGTVLGKITSGGKYGPYDPTASDGRQSAAEILFGSLTVNGATVLAGAGVHKGEVDPSKLPFPSGTGSLDAAARQQLYLVRFSDAPTVLVTSVAVADVPATFADLAAARTYISDLVDALRASGVLAE